MISGSESSPSHYGHRWRSSTVCFNATLIWQSRQQGPWDPVLEAVQVSTTVPCVTVATGHLDTLDTSETRDGMEQQGSINFSLYTVTVKRRTGLEDKIKGQQGGTNTTSSGHCQWFSREILVTTRHTRSLRDESALSERQWSAVFGRTVSLCLCTYCLLHSLIRTQLDQWNPCQHPCRRRCQEKEYQGRERVELIHPSVQVEESNCRKYHVSDYQEVGQWVYPEIVQRTGPDEMKLPPLRPLGY